MRPPYNSSESDDEDNKASFDFENIDSPRLQAKAALKISPTKKLPSVMDSIPTFAEMQALNATTRCDRLSRPPVWKWRGEAPTNPLHSRQVKILVCNWNLLGKLPAVSELRSLLNPEIRHDVYVLGTEECQRSIAASFIWKSKQIWEDMVAEVLGKSFTKLCSDALMATHMVVFVSHEVLPLVKDIQLDHVATGIGNTIGNKGGVGMSFCIGETSFVLMVCHLSAGQEDAERRNADFERIEKAMPLRCDQSKEERVSERADVAIVLGDMNYRVNTSVSMAKYLIDQELYEVVVMNDQLTQQRKMGKFMQGLQESKIEFAPTYKFIPGTDIYSINSEHIPSYTDRILYRSKREGQLRQVSYDSNNLIKTSDHRPVFAQFLCKFDADIKDPENVVPKEEAIVQLKKQEGMFGQAKSATCSIF